MGKKQKKKNKKKSTPDNKPVNKPPVIPPTIHQRDIPVYDMFKYFDIDDTGRLEHCFEEFLELIESGYYLTWDAVIREELGLPLTDAQEKALSNLVSFDEDDFDDEQPVLYIDEVPRPKIPWYETARIICPKMIIEPSRTFDIYFAITHEGWGKFVDCLEEYGENLSLPEGISTPIDVIPVEIRHKLSLQSSFEDLLGLGQEGVLPLESCDYRITGFIEALKECKESVDYFDLTLRTLFEKIVLPPDDEHFLTTEMIKRLHIKDKSDKLSEYL